MIPTLPGAFRPRRWDYFDALVTIQALVEGPTPRRWCHCGFSRVMTCAISLVRTSAELVIGLLREWQFRRERDAVTACAELRVSPRRPG